MSRIIEAKAILSGEDRTGKMFDSFMKHMKEAGKASKVAKDVGQLGKQLDTAARGLKEIQSFRSTQAAFGQARTAFRSTQAEVARLAKELDGARKAAAQLQGVRTFAKSGAIAAEMAAARKQVSDLERQFSTAQRAVKAAASSFDAQSAALKGAKHALDGSGIAVNRLTAEETRLKAAIDGVNAAYARQAGLQKASHRDAIAAGMGSADHARQQQDRASRRMADAMGAPAIAARQAAEARAAIEQAHLRKRASASGDLIAGMGGVGRGEAARIEHGRRLAEGMGAPARAARAERERMAAEHAAEAEVLARGQAERRRHMGRHGVVNAAAAGAAGYVSVHGIGHGVKDTLKAGAGYQHEVVALQNAGRTPEEMQEIFHASRETAKLLPTATFEENLKVINETTGAFGTLHHAIENLTFMQKASSVLHNAAGDKIQGGAGELGNKLARFFEERQVAGDTATFQREAEGLVRAMAFTRGNFNPAEAMNFAQQAKSALPNYSERFLTKIAPSLVTMMGGDRAGTAANAYNSVITGKVNDKKQAEAWLQYGLLDPSKVIMKAGHAVGWSAGAVKDTNGALTDPLKHMEEVILPALKKHGVNTEDRLELTKALATMFRNQNGNVFANDLAQPASRSRLHKDEANINQAGSLDEIYKRNLSTDPTATMGAIRSGLENLMAAASSPAMQAAAAGLNSVAGGLSSLALAAKDHPIAAMGAGAAVAGGSLAGAGWLSYQLMNGFGLGTSAAALDGSAAALTAAALKLGGSDLLKQLPGGVPLSGTPGKATGAMGRVGQFGRAALPFIGTAGLGVAAIGAGVMIVDATLPNANRMNGNGRQFRQAGGIESYPGSWGQDWHDVSGGIGANGGRYVTNRDKTWGERIFGSTRAGGRDPTRMELPSFGFGAKGMPGDPLPETQGPQRPGAVPLPPQRPLSLGGGTIPVEIVAMRKGADPSGQVAALNNTLDGAANASATAANGGKPIEASVKPDQITAKVTEIPSVSGEATVTLNPQTIRLEINSDMIRATAVDAARSVTAKIPLASSGARPGAVSMPGAASTPGAR